EVPAARTTIEAAIRSLNAPLQDEAANQHAELAVACLRAWLPGERSVASTLMKDAIARGVSLRDVYLHVFQPAQHEIGRRWQRHEITVADGHLAQAITQVVVSAT